MSFYWTRTHTHTAPALLRCFYLSSKLVLNRHGDSARLNYCLPLLVPQACCQGLAAMDEFLGKVMHGNTKKIHLHLYHMPFKYLYVDLYRIDKWTSYMVYTRHYKNMITTLLSKGGMSDGGTQWPNILTERVEILVIICGSTCHCQGNDTLQIKSYSICAWWSDTYPHKHEQILHAPRNVSCPFMECPSKTQQNSHT